MIKRKGFTRKQYTLPEMTLILNSLEKGESFRDIAQAVNRTSGGVRSFYRNWKKFESTGTVDYWVGKRLVLVFKQYQKSLAEGIEVGPILPEGTLEGKVAKLTTAFDELKSLIVDVVDEAVKSGVQKEVAEINKELVELRDFKNRARMQNLGDTLMKKLRG